MHYCDNIQEKTGWLLSVLNHAGDWVSEQILLNLYRRWVLGARWCRILQSDDWNQNPNINKSFSFMDLLEADLIEVTHFGKGNLYRLSERSKSFFAMEKKEVNKFQICQF